MHKRIRLFKAYISFRSLGHQRIYIVENCVEIKGRLAQLHKGRLRPLCINLHTRQIDRVMAILRKSYGSVTPSNYLELLPYMAKLEINNRGRVVVDLDSDHGLGLQWLQIHKAKCL
ncbi:hypothetical protein [Jiulongibacter sp. NS-SX5]|uniref:hypothetical protein n=1 Tax=Jiulongibacter sp. NS-SX5 TaxID=3463854 RepID=UPI004059A983